jgi:dTDP-4-amino-4,6-dideoxygalactose transaminase
MFIQRTLPPAAAPMKSQDLLCGLVGILFGDRDIAKLEFEIKEYFGVKHVFLVSSGKAALTLILLALKRLSNRRQVLIPAYTCFSVPSAIVKAGLQVALCDINPANFDFDQKLLKEAINENTLCVVPHHLFDIPADMDRVTSLCKERGIFVVEDVAQAMGGSYREKKLGTIGDVGFFSLGRGKNITCGSGGIIITNSDRVAEAIAGHYLGLEEAGVMEAVKEFCRLALMSMFIHPRLYWLPAGIPSLQLGQTLFYKDFPIRKMSGMNAGVLHHWRNRLAESNRTRAKTAAYFSERLRLKSVQDTPIPYLRLPILVDSPEVRGRVHLLSRKMGLGITPMYPTPINEIEELRTTFKGRMFPSASRVAERLLTIPTHGLLSDKDKKNMCRLFTGVPVLDERLSAATEEIGGKPAALNSVELLSAYAEDPGREPGDGCVGRTLRSSKSEGGCFGGFRRRTERIPRA